MAVSGILKRVEGLFGTSNVEADFLLLLNYMTSLATSAGTRDDFFEYLSDIKIGNGYLEGVFQRIRSLAVTWQYGYINSTSMVAAEVKNKEIKNFLIRLSHTLIVGEPLLSFCKRELDSFRLLFIHGYQSKIKNIETLVEIYITTLAALAFASVAVMLTTLIFIGDPRLLVAMTMLAFGFAGVYMLMIIAYVTPKEKLTIVTTVRTKEQTAIRRFLPLSLAGGISLAAVMYLLTQNIGYSAVVVGVFFIPIGILGKRDEANVKARQVHFPTFIRSLGATTKHTGLPVPKALRSTKENDFGLLSIHVRRLYSWLNMAIPYSVAWDRFVGETGSNLVHSYSRVFRDSVSLGADAEEVGNLLNETCIVLNNLRSLRDKVSTIFRSYVFPAHIALSALLIFMASLIKALQVLLQAVGPTIGFIGGGIPSTLVDLFYAFAIMILVVINSLAIKEVSGSTYAASALEISLILIATGLLFAIIPTASESMIRILTAPSV